MAHRALAEIVSSGRRPGFQFYEPDVTTNIDYSDSWTLYNWVRTHQPKEVLELGPGISTQIIALALHENGGGRVTTLEDVEKFYLLAKEQCPPRLQPYVDFRLTRKVEKQYGPFRGVGYENIPDRLYDFVFVDGPNYDADTQYDVDVLEIISKSERPVSAIVDSRTGSSFVYNLVLGDKFKYRYLTGLGYIDAATKQDVLPYRKVVAAGMRKRVFRRWR